MKNGEFDSISEGKSSMLKDNSSLNLLELTINDKVDNKFSCKPSSQSDAQDMYKKIDYSMPLDGSKSKALPEFITLTPESNKTGADGVWSSVKDTLSGIFGERDTLHNHSRMLARAGMTEAERGKLAAEEKQINEYNKQSGEGLWKTGFAVPPKTPMLDELDRRTVALEKSISQTAKNGMTPLQVAQLESGQASDAVKAEYAKQLIAVVNQYDHNGSVPKDVYQTVVKAAAQQKIEDEKVVIKCPSMSQILPDLRFDLDADDIRWINQPSFKTLPNFDSHDLDKLLSI